MEADRDPLGTGLAGHPGLGRSCWRKADRQQSQRAPRQYPYASNPNGPYLEE